MSLFVVEIFLASSPILQHSRAVELKTRRQIRRDHLIHNRSLLVVVVVPALAAVLLHDDTTCGYQ